MIVYISIEVNTIDGITKVTICFKSNVNELFSLDYYDNLDVNAHINTLAFKYKLLTLARIRVLRAVYEVIGKVLQNNLGFSNYNKNIVVNVNEATGKIG